MQKFLIQESQNVHIKFIVVKVFQKSHLICRKQTFYKSDTISIARITNQFPDYLEINRESRELDYNNNKNITKFKFKKNHTIDIGDFDIKSWTETKLKGKWKWEFDSDTQLLKLSFNRRPHSSFLIIEKITDSFIWKYSDRTNVPKEEVYNLLVYKLVRLN